MARRAYVVTVLWTGPDKSEQVWSAIFPQPWVACCSNLAHPQTYVQFSNRTSLETLQPSKVVETTFRHTSIGVMCEMVWSATFLAHLQEPYVVAKLSISQVRMWNFTRIGRKTKKLWLLIIPARRWSHKPLPGQPKKGVNRNFSWPHLNKPYFVEKLFISEA